jgi:hypothetical protein
MTSSSLPPDAAVVAAILEVERFEWTAPDRIELSGIWYGLRGRRFIRPTLVLTGPDGAQQRLLALLEHKPWAADDGEDWIAAFAWEGDPIAAESAELNVGSGIDLLLPAPRPEGGQKPARRFRHRAVSRDATRDTDLDGPPVDPAPAKPRPKRPAKKAPAKKRASSAVPAERGARAPAAQRTGDAAAAEPPAAAAEPAAAAAPDLTAEVARLQSELIAAIEGAAAAEARAGELRKERDDAIGRRKAIAGQLEAARQERDEAVRAARAEEREIATNMLAEGAELRAGVERQREMAYAARDAALQERDEAVQAKEQALSERKDAIADRKAAFRERDVAYADRDQAQRDREAALAARDEALLQRSDADRERDAARSERDTIVSVHERGLPVKPPQPRHLPADRERSPFELWMPRIAAAGALTFLVVVVIRMVAGS